MANPSYYQTSRPIRSQVQHQEHIFHLYAHQHMGNTEFNIVPAPSHPNSFGWTNVMDWDVHDAPEIRTAVVARMQGVGISTRKNSWYYSSILAFTDERFKGSTISMQGPLGPANIGDEGHWAVVGGTGEFVHAQGSCSYKRIQTVSGGGMMNELRIRVVCLIFPKPVPVKKLGPWGGNGGAPYEINDGELPRRLESLTIYATDFIQTIAFSYTDQAGQNRTVDPWGGDAGKFKHTPIQFGPLEYVKEIYGTTGSYGGLTVVTSLTTVTNVKTYGPYGKQSTGNTPFHAAAPDNHSIVGFYGHAGDVVDQIGVYTCPN